MRRFVALALAIASPTIGSCVLVDAPSNHESHPVSADDFCTRISEVICDGITECCDQPAVRAMYANRSMCVSRVATGCMNATPSLYALVHSPVTGYDSALGGDVVAEARYRASQCDLTIAAWVHQREGFLRVFPGTVGPGGQCLMGDPAATANAPDFFSCSDPDHACQLDRTLRRGTCDARVGAGESCIVDLDCQDGMFCAPSAIITGTCTALLPTGGACSHNTFDQGAWCQSGVCSMGVCQAATVSNVYCIAGIP